MIGFVTLNEEVNFWYSAILIMTAWTSGGYYHNLCYRDSIEYKYISRFRKIALKKIENKTYIFIRKCWYYTTI